MSDILTHFFDASAATSFGLVGLAGQLVWPLFRNRKHILGAQIGIASCYATQYALLDQWSGTGVCSVGATQSFIALLAGDRPWLKRMGLGFIPVVILISGLTWSGMASLLAMTA